MNNERAAQIVATAYRTREAQYGAKAIVGITSLMELTDLTVEQFEAGVIALSAQGFVAIPESNQKMLTQEDHNNALWIGNQWKHLLYAR
jgi:hypothetical protein